MSSSCSLQADTSTFIATKPTSACVYYGVTLINVVAVTAGSEITKRNILPMFTRQSDVVKRGHVVPIFTRQSDVRKAVMLYNFYTAVRRQKAWSCPNDYMAVSLQRGCSSCPNIYTAVRRQKAPNEARSHNLLFSNIFIFTNTKILRKLRFEMPFAVLLE